MYIAIERSNSICVIPARGGSKGVVNKNIIDIHGKPLISFAIKTAIRSNRFDKVIVTTDSEEIANISTHYGAEVPFMRPKSLSTDEAIVDDTLVHCLKNIKNIYKKYQYVCLRQATTPLVSEEDISGSFALLAEKEADMIVSVSETPCNINWVGILDKDMSMKNFKSLFESKICGTRRQNFPETHILNGGIYLGKWDIFYNKKDYYKQNTYAYIMPLERSIDIDSYNDVELLRYILKR